MSDNEQSDRIDRLAARAMEVMLTWHLSKDIRSRHPDPWNQWADFLSDEAYQIARAMERARNREEKQMEPNPEGKVKHAGINELVQCLQHLVTSMELDGCDRSRNLMVPYRDAKIVLSRYKDYA